MNQQNIPDREQVRKTVSKSRQKRRELELASLKLEDFIVRLEKVNCSQRSKAVEQPIMIILSVCCHLATTDWRSPIQDFQLSKSVLHKLRGCLRSCFLYKLVLDSAPLAPQVWGELDSKSPILGGFRGLLSDILYF